MRLPVYECCVCNRHVVAADATLFKILYRSDPTKGNDGFVSVDEWYSGIRAVCKWCVGGMKKLLLADKMMTEG